MTTALGTAATRWFESRGLDIETVVGQGVYTIERDRDEVIVFPFLEDGQEVGRKYRGRDKKFWQEPGGRRTFFNRDAILDPALRGERAQRLIVTEGEIDCLTAIECGYPLAVSVPDGAPATVNEEPVEPENDGKFQFIHNNWGALEQVRHFVLAVDGDGPGQCLAAELVRRLRPERCFFVVYPEGCKDLNDVLAQHGKAEVARVLNAAKPYPVKGLYRIEDFPDLPEPVSYTTGWPRMDEHFRVQLGSFIVVTGVPSHGKSAWVNALSVNLAEAHGWTVAVGSFEEPPVPYHRDDLRRLRLRADPRFVEADRVVEADAWIAEHFLFIAQQPDDETEDFDLDFILELARTAVVRHGIKVFVLDPWNEIEHRRYRDESETEYIGRAIRALKRFARRHEVAVIVVAHPTKMGSGKDGVICPTLYDISGSAAWFSKADVGIVVWRKDLQYPSADIRVRKARRRSIGKVGDVSLDFDETTLRFRESDFDPAQGELVA